MFRTTHTNMHKLMRVTWRHGRELAGGQPRPSARFRLLYCKMRCVHEANFLAYRRRTDSRPLPAAVLRVQVSLCPNGYGALRTTGHELAAASCLLHSRGWSAGAGRSANAGLPSVFGPYLRHHGACGPGCAVLRRASSIGGGPGCLPADGGSGRDAGIAQAQSGELAARLYSDAVDRRAVPLYG